MNLIISHPRGLVGYVVALREGRFNQEDRKGRSPISGSFGSRGSLRCSWVRPVQFQFDNAIIAAEGDVKELQAASAGGSWSSLVSSQKSQVVVQSRPSRRGQFTTPVVYQLLNRRALIGNERSHNELLGAGEWWLTDLARELKMSHLKLRDWASRGWVHSRKTPVQGYRILWADPDEVNRLRELLAQSRRGVNAYTSELKTPKKRASQS